jgi:hypothetical protein
MTGARRCRFVAVRRPPAKSTPQASPRWASGPAGPLRPAPSAPWRRLCKVTGEWRRWSWPGWVFDPLDQASVACPRGLGPKRSETVGQTDPGCKKSARLIFNSRKF